MIPTTTSVTSPNFKKLEATHDAIKDIDRILSNQSQEKLDEAMHAISEIDKTEFSIEDQNTIISGIRSCLLKIYNTSLASINSDIGINEVAIKREI